MRYYVTRYNIELYCELQETFCISKEIKKGAGVNLILNHFYQLLAYWSFRGC